MGDSNSVQTNIREKDDIRHSLDNQGHQDRQRSDTASLMIILSETSSRLSNSISKVSKSLKSPASDSGKAKDWSRLKLPENSSSKRYLGLLLAFISGVMMTTYSSMIKMLDTMDSMQVVVIRGSLQFFIMGSIAMYKNVPFKGTDNRRVAMLLFIVAFTGGLRIFFIFTSFSRLPLGDTTTILFSSPVIVMVLSMFILHERCGIFRMVAATTLLGGVILISKPPFIFGQDENLGYDAVGYSLVLSACGLSALGIVLTKLISKQVEKLIILFYLGLATTLCGSVGLFVFGHPSLPGARDWVLAVVIGLLGMVQQYILVWAVQLESPARVTVVRQFQIVLAYAVQVIMFGVMPTWTDMLGAGLVLVTVISIPFEKFINSKLCPVASEEDCDEQDRTVDNDVKKEHFNDKV